MKCRVVFPNAKDFKTLDAFFEHAKRALSDNANGGYAANFFLYGEDVLGVYKLCKPTKRELVSELLFGELLIRDREAQREILKEKRIVPHEEALKLAGRLQKILRPVDFVIFSAFAKVHGEIMNVAYLVGKNQILFDFKRTASDGDRNYVDSGLQKAWELSDRLNIKKTTCLNVGGTCVTGIQLLVCADIGLLQRQVMIKKIQPGDNIIFIPAYGLPAKNTKHALLTFRRGRFRGHIFINDQENGRAWSNSFDGTGKGPIQQFTKFKGKPYLYAEFEAATG